MDIVVVTLASLVTSILSAIAGLGGGIILLAVIAQFLPPTLAIPVHGGIQFVSNGSRAIILRPDISWPAIWRSTILMVPASVLGVVVASAMPVDATRLVLGVFVLATVWKPSLLRWRGTNAIGHRGLLIVGAVSGFLNTTIGASGPFTSPFFRAVTASHKAFVATAAMSQVFAHATKISSYAAFDGFRIGEHLPMIGCGAAGVVVGSMIGTRLLGRASEESLDKVFKVTLTVLAIRLIVLAAM